MAKTDELLRSGAISSKQASKQGLAVLKKTTVERDNEEPFHGKQGLRDQGGHKDKGHKNFRTKHIEGPDQGKEKKKNTGYDFDDRLSNKKGSPGCGEIDEAEHQKPDFPKEGRGKETGNKKAKGKIAKQGGQYGGGGRNTQ